MASSYWDEKLAERCRNFHYQFGERTLAGRALIVAGGTGGLGAATVALLAQEGAELIVGYRSNRTRAEALEKAVYEQFRRKLILVEGDLLTPEVRRNLIDAASRTRVPLAGAAILAGDPARVRWEELDREKILSSLEANYVGPVLLAKELGDAMEQSGSGGSLVLLATMQAISAFPSSLSYAAPKAALVHAARILAQQWRSVRVNVVAPGATMVGMAESSVGAGKYDRFIERGAIPRFGRPEDIGRAIRFFLEPDNYITGQALVVDGGLTLRRDVG
jgi:3-oxoacyl-[acyl-carrier protein] reductase